MLLGEGGEVSPQQIGSGNGLLSRRLAITSRWVHQIPPRLTCIFGYVFFRGWCKLVTPMRNMPIVLHKLFSIVADICCDTTITDLHFFFFFWGGGRRCGVFFMDDVIGYSYVKYADIRATVIQYWCGWFHCDMGYIADITVHASWLILVHNILYLPHVIVNTNRPPKQDQYAIDWILPCFISWDSH